MFTYQITHDLSSKKKKNYKKIITLMLTKHFFSVIVNGMFSNSDRIMNFYFNQLKEFFIRIFKKEKRKKKRIKYEG